MPTSTSTSSNPPARYSLAKRKNSYGEYVVRAYSADGARMPECDYFTDNWDDAVATRAAMLAA